MIEHLRPEARIVQQLFDGGARLIETGGSRIGPGFVEVEIGGKRLSVGQSFAEAIRHAVTAEGVGGSRPLGAPSN